MQDGGVPGRCRLRGRLLLALLLSGSCGSGDVPLSGLLLTLDTTRHDAPSCYGRTRGLTPALDRLAAEGVLFEAAYTVAPITLPAHASMLTGLYPPRHGLRENGIWSLSGEVETVAESAAGIGYRTAAFVASVVLDARFGLDQGFEVYEGPERPAVEVSTHGAELRAEEVADRALAWLRREDDRPFFLWVHFYDPHGPLDPPQRFRGGPLRDQPYLGEVAAVDEAVARLVLELEESGALERTLVVWVADHGEAFGAHGEPAHGAFAYEATIRVPFVVRFPDGHRAGEREERIASVVDVAPTFLEAFGLAPDRLGGDGRSLFRRRVEPERGAYLESYMGYLSFGWSPLAGWVDPGGKYLHSPDPELYDLRSDPGERHNLAEDGADLGRYRDAIAAVLERPAYRARRGSVDRALAADIQALGYAAVADAEAELPHPLAPSDRPSPHSRMQAHRDALRAMELANGGRLEEAAELFEGVLATNPVNPFALDRLADVRKRQRRFGDAVVLYRRLLSVGPEWSYSLFGLGVSLMETGDLEGARAALERALELDPGLWNTVRAMVQTLERRGDADEARFFRDALSAPEVPGRD